jgi:glutathione synthase/RimK-type ligase-like ATP-grasp enzyme
MQSSRYHSNQWLIETISEICMQQGIIFRSLSDDWLLELEKDGQIARVLGYTFDLNGSAASSIGRDKVAAYELLTAYGVPAISHFLVRLKDENPTWSTVDWEEGVVVKPLTGGGGENVCLFHDIAKAKAFMTSKMTSSWAISPLVDINREVRLIMLDEEVIFSYGKVPVVTDGLKVFNLSRGATPVVHTPTKEQIALARKTQTTLGLRLAAVDIVELASGEQKILEVNSAVTMKMYTEHDEKHQLDAKKVYTAIIKAMIVS